MNTETRKSEQRVAGHTPGPWEAKATRIYANGREVAVATKADPAARHRADTNARLIAAAPEILELARDLLLKLEMATGGFPNTSETRLIGRARALLQRVEG